MNKPCEYCGCDLPLGVDKKTRQHRSHHFATCKARPVCEVEPPAQQEPVVLPCCGFTDARAVRWNFYDKVVQCHNCGQVYTSPPAQRKPLTDEEIDAAVKAWFENDIVAGRQPFSKRMRAAIEAAHGIKENT